MPDAFEQELLNDIAEADSFGENALAAEWRLELRSYRAAQQQALVEDRAWEGTAPHARRQALDKRQPDQP
jgi:hypothetical protein